MKARLIGLLAGILSLGLIGSASAADMAVKARPMPLPDPVFSWTGFYIGVHGGGAWFDKNWDAPLTATNINGGCPGCPRNIASQSASSWLAGGQIGYNFQSGMWVYGVEFDGSWTDLKATSPNALSPANLFVRSKTDAMGTLAARLGVAVNQTLFYVKGGGAIVGDRFSVGLTATGVDAQATSATRGGWMVGVGVEYAFAPSWSVKAEYNHLDFGTARETVQPLTPAVAPFDYDIRQRIDLVKVGLNYRFGGPIVAKY